jgi:hypothetical protein
MLGSNLVLRIQQSVNKSRFLPCLRVSFAMLSSFMLFAALRGKAYRWVVLK